MVSRFRIKREREYPLPHDHFSGIQFKMELAATDFTNWPILMHDEAILPAGKFTNPEHASFAEYVGPNCSADSEVTSIFTEIRFTLTPGAVATDSLQAVRVCFLPIASAFEDLLAIDELTSVEVQDVLEMTSEATDRQAFPLWTDTDMPIKYTGSSTLGADVPGLDTGQLQESVAFDIDLWYDAIKYYTIAGKLRSVTKGLRWITLTPNNPTRKILIRQTSKTKRMNPYTQKSVIVGVPKSGTKYQIALATDTSGIAHVTCEQQTRFLEWNNMYHSERA